jgi:hypothetical protein
VIRTLSKNLTYQRYCGPRLGASPWSRTSTCRLNNNYSRVPQAQLLITCEDDTHGTKTTGPLKPKMQRQRLRYSARRACPVYTPCHPRRSPALKLVLLPKPRSSKLLLLPHNHDTSSCKAASIRQDLQASNMARTQEVPSRSRKSKQTSNRFAQMLYPLYQLHLLFPTSSGALALR